MSKQAKPRPQFIAHFVPAVMIDTNRPNTISTFAVKESEWDHTATPPQHRTEFGLIWLESATTTPVIPTNTPTLNFGVFASF
jgi:hypothetical protein